VGGDGTINEVVNGFFDAGRLVRPEASLGILPCGTGGDFRRSLGIPNDPARACEILSAGATLPVDVGMARYEALEGARAERYFINVVSFGMGGEVAARSQNAFRALGGKAAFLYATLGAFVTYRGREVALSLDGAPSSVHRVLNIAVGNARYHGGGMHVCPRAELSDGLLEITVIEHLNPVELAWNLPVLYSENIYKHPKALHYRARHIVARGRAVTKIEVDGEPLGRLPVELSLAPERIRVIVPERS
jgi:diacylglycerol kinase (ATP)